MSQEVFDLAHRLAGTIRASEVYRRYQALKDELAADPAASDRLGEFRGQQLAAQAAQFLGRGLDESEQERMHQLHDMLSLDPRLKEFVECEAQVLKIMVDVQKIIGDSVELFDDMAETLGKFPWPGFGGDEGDDDGAGLPWP